MGCLVPGGDWCSITAHSSRVFAAKPATTKVKVRAMKKLKDAALG